MSASRWARELLLTTRSLVYGLIGWVVISPLSFIIPNRPGRIAVIGRYDGEFADNAKYFFLQSLHQHEKRDIAFITERRDVEESLSRNGCCVYRYPSFRSLAYLAQSSLVVVDSNEWAKKFRRFIVSGSRVIQLWHGVGFKRIQLNKINNEVSSKPWLSLPFVIRLRKVIHLLSGKRTIYDLLITTSEFYLKNVFETSFLSKNFIISGYPRNTFGIDLINSEALWIGADRALYEQCLQWSKLQIKIILVMPTFRDSGKHPMELDAKTVEYLDSECAKHGFEILFKFHPYEKNTNNISGNHLHVIRGDSDIYPIIPLTSALITDYSSIYTDYSLINRPMLFFVPDIDGYVKNDRQFQFNYDSMTPGPKLKTWEDVVTGLNEAFAKDPYRSQRHEIMQLAFDGMSQFSATKKILDFALSKHWTA